MRWQLERARERVAAFFSGLFKPERKPRLCFNCGLLVGADQDVCSNCGTKQGALSLSAFKRVALAVIPAETPVTYALLFANLLLFAVCWVASARVSDEPMSLAGGVNPHVMLVLGAKQGMLVLAGQWWRLVMANFLHWDLMHIAFNSIALLQLGPQVEEAYGSRRYLFLYLVTGIGGFVASTLWNQMGLSAGASAAIFGLMGILITRLKFGSGFARDYRAQLIRWAIIGIVLGLFLPFDTAGHIGGLASGLVLGRIVSDRRPATPGAELRVNLMAWGAGLAIIASVVIVVLNLPAARKWLGG
ncbi:MAG TPA: rhomboid family intramembrane serine protease [Candidatus Xenobia bacterium]|nr:rhomboid family intramembrane serine protease [Candidatus Xenobia bacterium]